MTDIKLTQISQFKSLQLPSVFKCSYNVVSQNMN
uniref:Uncharacterized protein n=1 Tax=Manihot esculenta TaxID=3983 RepID=A0A2C9V085_MANES